MPQVLTAAPQDLSQTGVRRGLLEDLALKILFVMGDLTGVELGKHMGLGFAVADEIAYSLRKDHLCQAKSMNAGVPLLTLLDAGRQRAAALLELCQYTGPAPVSLMDYSLRVRAQRVDQTKIIPKDLVRAFHSMVLDAEFVARLGAAISSGQAIFLYGPPGTGKTSVATAIASIFQDTIWIPHAIEVDNQIISIFDPGVHRPSDKAPPDDEEYDRRWVLCHRPCVIAGGELSLEMLDLQPSATRGYFAAPLQMKANNGVLVIDDFGRQRMQPHELFNRWMTPLDRKVDYLTVPGGRKFEMPFDCSVIFATNLDPKQLADRAFLRRLPNKLKMDYATPKQFAEIFRRECETKLLDCDDELIKHTIQFITKQLNQPLSHCYARDVINQAVFFASFLDSETVLTKDAIERACRSYFLEDI
jgi:hypothetical protein